MQTDLQAPVSAPTMARLLAGLLASPSSDVPPLPETLGQWIDWPRAVALSRALDAEQASGQPAVRDEAPMRDASTQLRAGLQAAIFDAQAWAAAAPLPLADPVAAFAPLRQWYQGLQRKMAAATGRLRGGLRDALAQAGGASARLAELDAVMESVLSPREQGQLAGLPALLEQRYAALVAQGVDGELREFRNGVRSLLLAELDARFLPIDGLLAALTSQQERV